MKSWNKIKKMILRWAVRDLLKAVTIEDLLRIDGGKVFVGTRQLTPEEITSLKSEARSFQNSIFYKLLLSNLYWIANYKMMREADTELEMTNGRMMTLVIDTIQEFTEKFRILK